MNSVLLGGYKPKYQCAQAKKKRENKEPGEIKVIKQTLVATGDMQQQQKRISDGK